MATLKMSITELVFTKKTPSRMLATSFYKGLEGTATQETCFLSQKYQPDLNRMLLSQDTENTTKMTLFEDGFFPFLHERTRRVEKVPFSQCRFPYLKNEYWDLRIATRNRKAKNSRQ